MSYVALHQRQVFWRWVFCVTWLVIFTALAIWGPDFLPEKYFWDSNYMLDQLDGIYLGDLGDGSYYYTIRFFSVFGPDYIYLVNYLVGVLFVLIAARFIGGIQSCVMGSILIFPHLVLGLARPQKELLVTVLSLLALRWLISGRWSRHGRLMLGLGLLYLGYAIVRNYYIVIFAVFGLLCFWSQLGSVRWILVAAGGLLLLVLPESFFFQIQGTRDIFNAHRVSGIEGNETVYFNPFRPNNAFNFLANYLSAICYFNLPVLFNQGFNALFLQAYVAVVFLVLIRGYALSPRRFYLSLLFIAHLAVLLLFEPDMGSYMRHLSSVAIYLFPLMARGAYASAR